MDIAQLPNLPEKTSESSESSDSESESKENSGRTAESGVGPWRTAPSGSVPVGPVWRCCRPAAHIYTSVPKCRPVTRGREEQRHQSIDCVFPRSFTQEQTILWDTSRMELLAQDLHPGPGPLRAADL